MFEFYAYRFALLIAVLIIIYWLYKRKHKTNVFISTFPLIISSFFLIIAFTKVEISLGVGFGLFAIFSILRFRAEILKLHIIIFVFVGIALSILHGILPKENNYLLFMFDGIVLTSYLLILNFFTVDDNRGFDVVVSYQEYQTWNSNEKKEKLEQIVNQKIQNYKLRQISIMEDRVMFRVFCAE